MAVQLRNSVAISGIADPIPSSAEIFTQVILRRFIQLPDSVREVAQIHSAAVRVSVGHTMFKNTTRAVSAEGVVMTGRKLLIEAALKIRMEYSTVENTQNIYVLHAVLPFRSHVMLPEKLELHTPLTTAGYLEDIHIKPSNARAIAVNASILLNVEA